jgi:plastocyanin
MKPEPIFFRVAAFSLTLALSVTLGLHPARAATVQVTVSTADGSAAADTVVMARPLLAWTPRPPPPVAVITQKDVRFAPFVTVVPVGGAVRFVNLDGFDHHVRSQPGGPLGSVPPAKEFEYRLGPQGKGSNASPDLRLDVAGAIVLGCHLHNSMRGHLVVSATPWFGVSDANGVVRIEGLPEGAVELTLWHPEQLADQPPLRVQAATFSSTEARLNFTPPRRRH